MEDDSCPGGSESSEKIMQCNVSCMFIEKENTSFEHPDRQEPVYHLQWDAMYTSVLSSDPFPML